MLERLSWKRLVLELLLCCLPAFILGAFFGYLPWFLLASVTGLLIWHFWNLLRLSWWLWVDRMRKNSLLIMYTLNSMYHRFMFRHVGSIACLHRQGCKGAGITQC